MIDEGRTEYPSTVLTFLLGGLAGASLALLLAPQSGRETRHAVGRRVRGGVSAAKDIKDRVARRGGDLRDRASRAMSDLADDARDAAESIDDAVRARAESDEAFRADRTAL